MRLCAEIERLRAEAKTFRKALDDMCDWAISNEQYREDNQHLVDHACWVLEQTSPERSCETCADKESDVSKQPCMTCHTVRGKYLNWSPTRTKETGE